MTDTLQNFAIAVVQDVCSLVGIPCASTATMIYQEIQSRRLSTARDIAIEELRHGRRTLSSVSELDEQVAILHRYFRAAHEGTARLNLRLLAKIMAGHTEQAPLYASDFLYYADILSSLRREEIILLGVLYRNWKSAKETLAKNQDKEAYDHAKAELVGSGLLFVEELELRATLGALGRTGLILASSGYGGTLYRITPMMEKLARTASFEAAVQAEEVAQTTVKAR